MSDSVIITLIICGSILASVFLIVSYHILSDHGHMFAEWSRRRHELASKKLDHETVCARFADKSRSR